MDLGLKLGTFSAVEFLMLFQTGSSDILLSVAPAEIQAPSELMLLLQVFCPLWGLGAELGSWS